MSEYAGALVTFVNRADGKLSKAAMYPITRIELQALDGAIQQVFEVRDGRWVEVTPRGSS